ncbi:hypothetical protein [uncultured Corynebacterium sp.]|uniref:hypothetical protein n=1 Tax=uncultured Corynebacterium sp. TaxID=159447 RepID=UPI002597B094|nr:hypothetical protein [uncultured Corynebacterium sp.]
MQRLHKWQLAAFPVGIVAAALMAIASEIFSLPILVPLAFLPIIAGLVYLAPFLALGAGWCYEKVFGGGIQGTLISASLRYRATSIGSSVVLLFCICAVSTVTVGLANAGLGQVSSGLSYWKPGIHWGGLRDDAEIEATYEEFTSPGVMGTFGQGRLLRENQRSINAFVMSCHEYAELATDDPVCPADDAESMLIPVGMDAASLSSQFVIPVTDTELDLPPLRIQEVPGLTEILISTSSEEINNVGRYLYADLDQLPSNVVLSATMQTKSGLTSQERIDNVNSAMSSGYGEAASALTLSIMLFGLAAVSGIAIAAIRDRTRLVKVLTLRGVQDTVAKNLVRIETISLTLPFALFGCISGTLLAAAVAQVSSLNPRDAFTPHALGILAAYVAAVPIITEIQLRRTDGQDD